MKTSSGTPNPPAGRGAGNPAVTRRRRLRRAGVLAAAPDAIRLPLPPKGRPKGLDLSLAALGLLGAGLLFYLGGKVTPFLRELEDSVTMIEVEEPPQPPPPPEEIKEPPKPPPPPPPDPDVKPPPAPPEEPVKPVFGMEEDALSEGGDMSVATGNTLMKKADTVVEKAPPPLPPAPILINQYPAFVKAVPPVYPGWAEEQGVEASVVLTVTIDEGGRVMDSKVKKGAGRDFDRNALDAIRKTVFQPYIKDGRKLPAVFDFTFEYRL